MASTYHRHRLTQKIILNANEQYLTLANMMVKFDFLKTYNLRFDPLYIRNEENDFINRARKLSQNIVYWGDFFVYHHRKNNLKNALKAIQSSAHHRAVMIKNSYRSDKVWPSKRFILAFLFFWAQITLALISLKILINIHLCYAIAVAMWGIKEKVKLKHLFRYYLYHLAILYTYSIGLNAALIDSKHINSGPNFLDQF
jgi:GT2 family glycosyltransferase